MSGRRSTRPRFIRVGRDNRTAVAVATSTSTERPTPSLPGTLQKAIADWEEIGYSVKVGLELEAYVQPDGAGGWQPYTTPRSFVYGTGPTADPAGVIDDIMWTAEDCGFRTESINAEFDEGQFELTLEYDSTLKAVDDIFLFRLLARRSPSNTDST